MAMLAEQPTMAACLPRCVRIAILNMMACQLHSRIGTAALGCAPAILSESIDAWERDGDLADDSNLKVSEEAYRSLLPWRRTLTGVAIINAPKFDGHQESDFRAIGDVPESI